MSNRKITFINRPCQIIVTVYDQQIMSDLELGLQAGRRSYEEILKQQQDEGGHKTATTNEQVDR